MQMLEFHDKIPKGLFGLMFEQAEWGIQKRKNAGGGNSAIRKALRQVLEEIQLGGKGSLRNSWQAMSFQMKEKKQKKTERCRGVWGIKPRKRFRN